MVLALSELPLYEGHAAHDAMTFGVILVEPGRCVHETAEFLLEFGGGRSKSLKYSLAQRTGSPSVSRGEAWVSFDGMIKVQLGLLVGFSAVEMIAVLAAQQVIV